MILYRLALTFAAPGVALWLGWRLALGREPADDLRERLGRVSFPRDKARVLWIHGASNGEMTAARPLVEALLSRHSDMAVLITTNSVSGREMVRSWPLPRIQAQLAPLDYRACLAGFLGSYRPRALIVIENELWPNRLQACHARGIPVALVGARVSSRSAKRWGRAAGLVRPLLSRLAFVVPQDAWSAERLAALGVLQDRLAEPHVLKASVALPAPNPSEVDALGFDRASTVLAASTHAGEEEQVLRAFATARRRDPGLRLILAPRHPKRSGEIRRLIEAAGLGHAARSDGSAPGDAPVYLADTLGEMALWYSAAGLCFVGGSLVSKGGHTPFEPAQFGCALLTGLHVESAATAFERLHAAGAVRFVANADALADAIGALLPDGWKDAGERAKDALAPQDIAPLAHRLSDALALGRGEAPP